MLKKIINELKKDCKKLALLHINADADAVASAYALGQAFPKVEIGVAESLDRTAKKLAERLKLKVIIDPKVEAYKEIFVLDTSTPAMLGRLATRVRAPIIIDHHTRTAWENAKLYYCDETKSSCAEIVYELLKKINFKLASKVALALLVGIVTDTGRFRRASPQTFRVAAELLKLTKVKFEDIMVLTEEELALSGKIALLKGAQRVKYTLVNNRIIAWSLIGAFEGTVAKTLLLLGADCAVVGRQKNEEFVIIAKSKENLKINLGKLMAQIGKEVGAEGGGHKGAAGIVGKGKAEKIVEVCVERLRKLLIR